MAKTQVEVDLGRADTAESDPGWAGRALKPGLLGRSRPGLGCWAGADLGQSRGRVSRAGSLLPGRSCTWARSNLGQATEGEQASGLGVGEERVELAASSGKSVEGWLTAGSVEWWRDRGRS
jgi:hypothetical protein